MEVDRDPRIKTRPVADPLWCGRRRDDCGRAASCGSDSIDWRKCGSLHHRFPCRFVCRVVWPVFDRQR